MKKGLYIKKPWTDLILAGEKTWEVRGFATKIRGEIYIIESKSSIIVGKCELVDVVQLNQKLFNENLIKHQVREKTFEQLPYAKVYAWVLTKVQKINPPIPFKPKPGAIIWVNLEQELA